MTSALIGHTGFIGTNLQRQTSFDALYHSATIDSIAGKQFDLLICAGVRAEKWKANTDPASDWAGIERLISALKTVQAKEFVLMSTIDVFAQPNAVDETSDPDLKDPSPYGKHRRALERWAAQRFSARIVRLPGLFGPGLKKNVIYDFLNGNAVR